MNDSQHDRVRPVSFDEFIGQTATIRRLDVHMRASMETHRPLPHVLFVGTPGSGKTTLARLVAERLGDNLIELNRPPSEKQLRESLYELEAGVLFLDEIQEWSVTQQSMLLPLLEEGRMETKWGTDEFPFLTVIAATTDPQRLIAPLASPSAGRFPVRPSFEPYDPVELGAIAAGMAERAGLQLADGDADIFGRAAGGVPRRVRTFVLSAVDMRDADAGGRVPGAVEVLAFCQVDEDGMSADHRAFLAALAHMGGQAGVEVLASRLRMHTKAVKETESMLLDRGFIRLEARGRTLTADGRRRLNGNRPFVGRFARPAA